MTSFLCRALAVFLLARPSVAQTPYRCADATACDRPGHDPSALQRTSAGYYVTLVTGSGSGDAFGMKYLDPADYGAGWHQGAYSYLKPDWLGDYGPWPDNCEASKDEHQACPFWAPDLVSSGNGLTPGGDSFIMYYSVPRIKDQDGQGCIGRATGQFHAPASKADAATIEWTDAGQPVICTHGHGGSPGPHNIDPSVMVDVDGRWWLSYGSWSSTGPHGGGIWVVELNATTGMLTDEVLAQCGDKFPDCWREDNKHFVNVANNPVFGGKYADTNALEASYLFSHADGSSAGDQPYFLFVNYYWCCQGIDSTYELRVGRSASPTGPFVDKSGKPMVEGGGELLLQSVTKSGDALMVGPGHAGVLRDPSSEAYVLTFDFQGVDGPNEGDYKTQARKLTWDDGGWPCVSEENFVPAVASITV